MIDLPSGTVTFLFTDIEGSTQLAQQYPDEMPALLARHHAILHAAIVSTHGYVFQIIGDAFCAAFSTATDALNAAVQAQRVLQHEAWSPAPIKVRMGLNTGNAQAGAAGEMGGGYSGYSTLARVQRVMSTAQGGQILLAHATAELVRDRLPAEISLRDMGEHKLKGLLQPENLWQVVAPDLLQDFAPLQTLNMLPNNLPGTLNRLVGRAHELAEVKQRLSQTRLLTLLGPGGTGKTRLALQAAGDLLADYDDRVYFVDLASSRDTDAALAAIGRTIGVRESSDKPLLAELKEQIKHKKMLQLLDNFEQVTVAASSMAELLRDCPELKMLVTSREALHVRGENVYPVPPLGLPSIEFKHPSAAQLAQSEAVQLFIERAQAVKSNFELTNDNAAAVAEICARLDGLPLAIELATARLNVFTPQALAERLGNRLKLLRGGARDLPERHQTLRDTIDWSYEMLDSREQALFKLLAVFSGATLEAIEAVASCLEQFKEFDVFEAVSSLIDKSLIRQEETVDGEARLRMLETIREFATARLEEDAAFNTAARHAHATFFAEFTASQWIQLTSETRERAFSLLTIDLENIRTAWRYWADAGNLEQLSKFTDCLWLLYDARAWYHATIGLTTDLLKVLSTTVSTPDRLQQEIMLQTSLARALLTTKGYTPEVEQAYARALELCDKAGDVPQLFPVLRGLSFYYVFRTEYEKGIQMGERILKLAEHLNDSDMRAEGQLVLGYNIAFTTGLYKGLELLEQSIAGFDLSRQRMRRLGLGTNPGVVGLSASALLLWMIGFPDRAHKRMGEAVALSRKLDHPFSMAYAQFHFGLINLWLGNIKVAAEYAQTLIDSAEEHEFPVWAAVGACLRGTTLAIMGLIDEGVALIDRGIQSSRGLNTPPIFWPSLLQLQSIVYGLAGRPIEGLRLLDEATRITLATLNHTAASEFFCTKGDLLLAIDPNNAAEAEVWYQRAVDNARNFKAPMFELRAALKLSHLWQTQGKIDQARSVLTEAYAKMTEGFTTSDLKQAQALLKELM